MKAAIFVVAMVAGSAALVHADPSLRDQLVAIHNHLFHLWLAFTR